ncbi:hypothetical protein HBH70_005690 [Parastagonospora nodorum]|nr:hypothetical protein HBH52_039850 [Parastagonospora nodorum]KAH4041899.1 hypothetical protein HBI09_005950 [Parastagonospora nodorum]KAH4274586.1 hypothetical protein HBI03_014230 [Parastagonospora nodorum]KAH4284023.1 hypothetical protein HBI04_005720 [Parastagonospora nodorum]KAH4944976.1 hypothetical protein HBI79_005960 [Parastagonospora nodorum]
MRICPTARPDRGLPLGGAAGARLTLQPPASNHERYVRLKQGASTDIPRFLLSHGESVESRPKQLETDPELLGLPNPGTLAFWPKRQRQSLRSLLTCPVADVRAAAVAHRCTVRRGPLDGGVTGDLQHACVWLATWRIYWSSSDRRETP